MINEYRLKIISERIGLKIYKFSKYKHNACIYLTNTEDKMLSLKAYEFCGMKVNDTLKYDDVFTHDHISLKDLYKKYDFILMLDVQYNQNKNDIKMKIINTNTIKITYCVLGKTMTMNDINIFDGNFVDNLYTTNRIVTKSKYVNNILIEESHIEHILKKQYRFLRQ